VVPENAKNLKFTQQIAVPGLVVRVSSEHLLLLGGNGGVPWNENGRDSTSSFQTKRKECSRRKQRRRWLIDDTVDINTLDDSSILCNLIGDKPQQLDF